MSNIIIPSYWRYKKPVLGSQLNMGHPLSRGLVGCWLMNEGGGNIINDIARKNNGTLINGTAWSSGIRGKALNFDGVNDYVNVASPQNIPSGNSNYTIEAWIKPAAMGSEGIVGWGTWITNNAVNAFRLTDNGLKNYWWGNDLTIVTGSLVGAWHHVVAEFDGTTRKIFLDSALVGSDTPTGHNAVISNFRIGSTNNGEYFNGTIDEVRIYNSALSPFEIRSLYEAPYQMIQAPRRIVVSTGEIVTYRRRILVGG